MPVAPWYEPASFILSWYEPASFIIVLALSYTLNSPGKPGYLRTLPWYDLVRFDVLHHPQTSPFASLAARTFRMVRTSSSTLWASASTR